MRTLRRTLSYSTSAWSWFFSSVAMIGAVATAYYYWFSVNAHGELSRSPFVWTQFALYVAALSVPLVLSVTVAALGSFLSLRKELSLTSQTLEQFNNALERALTNAPTAETTRRVAMVAGAACSLIEATDGRAFSIETRRLFALRLRLSLTGDELLHVGRIMSDGTATVYGGDPLVSLVEAFRQLEQ